MKVELPTATDPLLSKSKSKQRLGFKGFLAKAWQQRTLMLMCVPFIIWLLIFRYVPVGGWVMAFQDFKPARGFLDQEWVGFKHFAFLFTAPEFYRVLRNTLAMSIINMVLGFITAISLAILFNEIRNLPFKRVAQTISYMPHFLSWVVAAAIVSHALSLEYGIVNTVLLKLRIIQEPIMWLGVGHYFWGIIGATDVWKNVGWNAIIYLAAIAMINPQLYEAAEIDGAGRLQRIWHITLPGMRPVIVILLIMNMGYILESGFEPQYLLGNPMNIHYSENLDIFVLRYGIAMGNFSLATAAGIFKTVISFIFLFAANYIAKRLGQARLF